MLISRRRKEEPSSWNAEALYVNTSTRPENTSKTLKNIKVKS
jgi:hypothetical protein